MLQYIIPKFAAAAPNKPKTRRSARDATGAGSNAAHELGFQEMNYSKIHPEQPISIISS